MIRKIHIPQIAFSLFIFTAFLFLNSCDPETEVPIPVKDEIIPTGDEQYLNFDADYIFDQSKLHTFELTLSEEALEEINSDPSAEQYVEGSLAFEGETLSPVGIRYKGSVGAFVNCLTGTNWAKPSGSKTCTKLSMKIKINWNGSDRRFYGLKKLQFHSQNLDPTQMRERLSYWLYRSMGVAAPRSVHARLMINGEYSGLYALTEQIDGRFTRHNFADGTGNLYKEIWPLQSNGLPYSEQTYLNNLETNKDENPSAQMMANFAREVSEATPATIQAAISKWMDVDKIIAYSVVDRTIRADDGAFHWYCNGSDCSNHNYFWYEEPTLNKLFLIPWDMDNTLENLSFDANPVTPIADGWGEITADCSPFSYGIFNLKQRSAACDKLTAGWVTFEDEYNVALANFLEGSFAEAQVNLLLDSWENQIRAATVEANEAHDDALTIAQWESALTSLKTGLDAARGE